MLVVLKFVIMLYPLVDDYNIESLEVNVNEKRKEINHGIAYGIVSFGRARKKKKYNNGLRIELDFLYYEYHQQERLIT